MRITKKQIRQIIKESFADAVNQGRAQSRAREKAEFGPNADRTLGIYASTSLLGRFEDAMDRLYEDIYSNALEDLEDWMKQWTWLMKLFSISYRNLSSHKQ